MYQAVIHFRFVPGTGYLSKYRKLPVFELSFDDGRCLYQSTRPVDTATLNSEPTHKLVSGDMLQAVSEARSRDVDV